MPYFARFVFACWIMIVFVLPEAVGQIAEDNALDQITDLYRDEVAGFGADIKALAFNLFGLLVIVEITWTGIKMVLDGVGLSQFTAALIQRIFFISLFLWLLQNDGFASIIVESFREAANIASGLDRAITPGAVFEAGLMLTDKIFDSVGFNVESVGLVLVALFIIVSFSAISAILIMALVEFYFLTGTGIFLLGFGGSRWTRDVAIKFMTYTLSVGVKLFLIQMIIGLGLTLITRFTNDFAAGNNSQAFIMVGVSLVFLALVLFIPGIVSGLVQGVTTGSSGSIAGAAGLAAGIVGGTAFAAGKAAAAAPSIGNAITGAAGSAGGAFRAAASTVGSAVQMATQSASGDGGGGGGGAVGAVAAAAKTAGAVAGHTAAAYGKAAASKVGDAVSAATTPKPGSIGARAASGAAAAAASGGGGSQSSSSGGGAGGYISPLAG